MKIHYINRNMVYSYSFTRTVNPFNIVIICLPLCSHQKFVTLALWRKIRHLSMKVDMDVNTWQSFQYA